MALSLLEELRGNLAESGWSAICAAWCCDDEGLPAQAIRCRERAADVLLRARDAGQGFGDDPGLELMVVDALRRSEQLQRAGELCQQLLSQDHEPFIRTLFELQWKLVNRGDVDRHTVAEKPSAPGAASTTGAN